MSDDDSTPPDGFRKIPGFPRYAIDENGTVLSVCLPTRGTDRPWREARRLRPDVGVNGYRRVTLCNETGMKRHLVHALVLETFVGPCPTGLQCRHLDGRKDNNHVSNLCWGTAKQNYADTVLHGTVIRGEKTGTSKLTASDVVEIRRRRTNGETLQSLASDFHISIQGIWYIVQRINWKHVA